MNNKGLIEEKALKRSMIGAFLLAVWGIVMASVSGSSVIMLDGMFNLISGIMSFFSIEITRLIYGKETREYPLGCLALFLTCRKGFKQTGSEILQAETQAWLVNAVVSGAIGIAFGITMLLKGTALGRIDRYIDQILVIILSFLFIKDPLVLIKSGVKELLLAAPQEQYVKPFEEKLLPLKDQLNARALAVEIIKTGRRLWLTVRLDPGESNQHR
jgi:predicted Co/Zn/Cd cation transporter (cation efflux family)